MRRTSQRNRRKSPASECSRNPANCEPAVLAQTNSAGEVDGEENSLVLHAIETALIHCHQDDDRVDDAVAMSTLNSMVRSDPPTIMPHAWVFAELADARASMPDLTPQTWKECLRKAMDSLGRSSHLRAGDTQYLQSLSRSVA